MALLPDGSVFPCRRLPLPQGNVLEEPFEAILARLAGWAPEALGPGLHGMACGLCGVEGCVGCRALALALRGDALADDPQCVLHLA
jgi:MoaA/NifB/PqqE/SkfB family radical SAM enzyme